MLKIHSIAHGNVSYSKTEKLPRTAFAVSSSSRVEEPSSGIKFSVPIPSSGFSELAPSSSDVGRVRLIFVDSFCADAGSISLYGGGLSGMTGAVKTMSVAR